MAEDKGAAAGGGNNESGQTFRIQKIYVKDVSFETTRSTEIFVEQGQWNPDVKVQLNTENRKIKDDLYECVLTVTVTVKQGEEPAYLAEVKQAGLFTISGFGQDQMGHLMGSYSPNVLFPFVRETLCELAVKGGYPQLLLDPINFDALYAQHLESAKQQAEATPETTH